LALGERGESDAGQLVQAIEHIEEVHLSAEASAFVHLIRQEDGRTLLFDEARHTGELARQHAGHTLLPHFSRC
jgi:hypothetical protein